MSVELTYLDEPYSIVTTRDISDGGMFIELKPEERFPIGELVNVHYLDPLDNDKDKFKDAIIVRVANDGIGLSFVEMTEF